MQTWNYDTNVYDFYDITSGDPQYLYNSGEIVNSYRLLNPNGFDPAADGKVVSPYERHNLYLAFNYAITDDTQLALDLRYTNVESNNTISPEFSYGSWGNSSNFASDVELSDAVWDLLAADGGWYRAPYTLNDLGPRTSSTERDLFAFSATLDGDLDNGWMWDVYLSTGRTNNDTVLTNYADEQRRDGNYTWGTDGICGVDDMSCPAWNSLQPMNQAVIDYVKLAPFGQQIETEQHLFAASLSGDILSLPYGDVMMATGLEARRESIDVQVDEIWQSDEIVGSEKLPWEKARNIYEAFVEVEVPLVSDVMLINDLSINAAARYADYTYSGDNTSWKLALNWEIYDELRLRSTYAHAVRAPQLKELFGAASTGFSSGISDPCDKENITTLKADEKALVIANCQAFGISDPENFESTTNLGNGTDVTTAGNPDLKVEKADTLTLGIAYEPAYLDNFAVTVDYYDIDLKDAIQNTSSSNILYECAESTDIDNSIYCPLVTRGDDGNITNVRKAPVNKGAFTRRGLDIEASYLLEQSWGDLSFNLYATHIIEDTSQDSPTDEVKYYQGVYGSPDWKGRFVTHYQWDDLSINWSIDHTSATIVKRDATIEDYDQPETPSSTVHNFRIGYDLLESTNLYVGVKNAFDSTWTQHPTTSSGGGAYSLMGRYYYAGFSYQF